MANKRREGVVGFGVGRFPFYSPVLLHLPYDGMTKSLMGASFVQTKPVPIHTETKGQEKEPVLFSSIQGLQGFFLQDKGWAPIEPRTPSSSGRRCFPEARRGEEEVGTREASGVATSQLAIFTMTS